MAVPTNEQIRTFLSNCNGQDTVLLRSRTVPPYPEPNVGDRYLLTAGRDKDCIFECTVPRRWTGALKINPRTGMQVLDKSTGEFWMYDGTRWTPALPYYTQMGVLMTGGSGITIYETTADLRVVPTINQGIEAGTLVAIGTIEFPSPGGAFDAPANVQWGPDVPIGVFPMEHTEEMRAQYEMRGIIIPDDVWALLPNPAVTGCWINPVNAFGSSDEDIVEIDHPMPLNNPPTIPVEEDVFLTGPEYFESENALAAATFTDGEWSYDHPSPGTYFRYANQQKVFLWSLAEDPDGWHFRMRDTNEVPLFPIVDGFANCPAELEIAPPNLDDVYLVGNDSSNEWVGHDGQFVWLDSDGATWMFGDMVIFDAPYHFGNSMVLVQELNYRAYWMMWVAGGSGAWRKLTADSEVTTNSPVTGTEPTVTLTGNIYVNWLNRRQQSGEVVFEFIPPVGPGAFGWLVSVTTGTPISMYRGYTTTNGDFAIQFSNAMGGGTGTIIGFLLVDGRLYPVSITINPP